MRRSALPRRPGRPRPARHRPRRRGQYFPGETVDGPSADIQRLGDVDVGRDGTGALVYVKRDGGVDHVFASRLIEGSWQPPERVDAGLAGRRLGAGRGRLGQRPPRGRLPERRRRVRRRAPGRGHGWSAPQLVGGSGRSPAVDMSINGVAYLTWTAPGASAADVRAARLERTRRCVHRASTRRLDIDPAADAGAGDGRSRVAVAADGSAAGDLGRGGPRLRAPAVRVPPVRRAAGPDAALAGRRAGRRRRRLRRRHRGRLELRLGRLPPDLRRHAARDRPAARRLAVRGARGHRRRRGRRPAADRHQRPRRRLWRGAGRRRPTGPSGRP